MILPQPIRIKTRRKLIAERASSALTFLFLPNDSESTAPRRKSCPICNEIASHDAQKCPRCFAFL